MLVTGGAGFIGSYVVENLLQRRGVPRERIVVPRSREHDLRNYDQCTEVVQGCDVVIHLAAVTGGISFSRAYPATQYYRSSLIDLNVVEAAKQAGVSKLVAIGNVFAYAPDAPLPLEEKSLFEGLPAPAHRGVGWMKRNLALIADLYQREHGFNMSVVYSANGYGPGDSTDPERAHVIPANIMKCLRQNELVVWGDGSPTRDFLYAADIAEGLLLAAEKLPAGECMNIGSEKEISIREIVSLIAELIGFRGPITYDPAQSGGDRRRVSSAAKAREILGFVPETSLREGLKRTIEWYRQRLGATA